MPLREVNGTLIPLETEEEERRRVESKSRETVSAA